MYQDSIKYAVKQASVSVCVRSCVQGNMQPSSAQSEPMLLDVHNGQETSSPFANNGTITEEEQHRN
jgi:hypothetical protein